ncbi:g-protein coupled receptor 1 [Colletotrichum scovillei]|uniref:G-protein coupled receptor 1 n=1 Tax=Colletotrichum scovillei TaxID=1209932 RepID=A0A9P7RIR4_9PEZI|nr:g-protein coupled receptor 1 [Colletotrichum scovillei]KAG7077448.1 g-protein coupled receptor 1 [Colletotrichum scovillei]KAG7084554.1 g-protein coupled receptor 1 [Colletotrichum scovillei]
MFLQNNTSNGSGLDQPPTAEEVRIESVVILVVSILSLCGAGFIMTSYWIFPNLRSFRHRLIIGLAISDFLMAFNFICSTTMNLSGRLIDDPEQTDFCKLNGFMAQVFVIQTDYWVLNIAICTFFILTGQRKRASWVQNHEVVIWGLPWFFSVLWASVGLGLNGYHSIVFATKSEHFRVIDLGGQGVGSSQTKRGCSPTSFLGIIITIMFALYAYLALVLFRAQNRLSSMQESPGHLESVYSTQDGSRAASTHEGLEGRSMIARLLLLYPLAYAIVWTIPTAIRIYQASTNTPAPFPLQNVDQACIVIQGLADAVIYGMNETSVAS